MGTRLDELEVDTSLPLWSARALLEAPEVVRRIHREYAAAGATVHTADTFRTRRRTLGEEWGALAARAVRLARESVPAQHRVAGSLAPLEDCYRPDLSPPDPGPEHRELARLLADEGVDLLLVETFPHVGEALVAVAEAVDTGVETWVSFTAGPEARLLRPEQVAEGARRAVALGARAVLINCTAASLTLPYVRALVGADLGVPVGAYANAGHTHEGMGWGRHAGADQRYAELAAEWVQAGASILGSCCGTGPDHVRALARLGQVSP